MSRSLMLIVVSLVATTGCKKNETETAASKPVEERITWGDQVPDTEKSRVFAEKLVKTEIDSLRVTDSGAVLTYHYLKFDADGSWVANGAVEVADEKMECQEAGTWSMDPAGTPTTARLDYIIARTDCAGREAGGSQRLSVDLSSDKPEILFR